MHSQPEQAIERQAIASEDLAFEFMMNALRLSDGVPSAWLSERTGISPAQIAPALAQAQQKGLLSANPTRFAPTEQGQRFLNDLLHCFL